MSKLYKKMNLDNLPRYKEGRLKGFINWKESIGIICKFEYGDIQGEIEILKYENEIITFKYLDKIVSTNVDKFKLCQLGRVLNKRSGDFKVEVGCRFKDDKRDLIITDKEYRYDNTNRKWKWYKYKCNKCGWTEGWINETHLLGKRMGGCSCCCNPPRTIVKGINDMATTEPWMVEYFVDEEIVYNKSCQSNDKVYVKCPDCGNVKFMIISEVYNRKGISCEKCGDGFSYPNKFMANLLDQLNIEFQTEYSPKWANGRRFDFYIPSKNLIIEMDGVLGHGVFNCKNKMSSQESLGIDESKDNKAIANNIKVIRIDCRYKSIVDRFAHIKHSVLESDIINYLDLNKVDWEITNELSCKSVLKEVCVLKNNNSKILISELADMFNISTYTVNRYLKIGNELGLCNYTKQDYYKSLGKVVNVYFNGEHIGVYESVRYLARNSERILGEKIHKSTLYRLCKDPNRDYNGFSLKYM